MPSLSTMMSSKALLAGLALMAATPAAAFVFPFSCARGASLAEGGSHMLFDSLDPIVNPGARAGHQHAIAGGNGFSASMTYEDTQASSCTTCKIDEDRSNYWTPSIYYVARNGSVTPLQSEEITFYYNFESAAGEDFDGDYVPFPPGYRILAGDATKRTPYEGNNPPITYSCHGADGGLITHRQQGLPKDKCHSINAEIHFPSCWNGKDLDTPDHKSHASWPSRLNTGSCPDGFRTRLPGIFMISGWAAAPFLSDDLWWEGPDNQGHPFVLSNGDTTGYGWHADFVNGWKDGVLQKAIDAKCRGSDCSVFTEPSSDSRKRCTMKPIHDPPLTSITQLPGNNPIPGVPGSGNNNNPEPPKTPTEEEEEEEEDEDTAAPTSSAAAPPAPAAPTSSAAAPAASAIKPNDDDDDKARTVTVTATVTAAGATATVTVTAQPAVSPEPAAAPVAAAPVDVAATNGRNVTPFLGTNNAPITGETPKEEKKPAAEKPAAPAPAPAQPEQPATPTQSTQPSNGNGRGRGRGRGHWRKNRPQES